MSLPDSPLLYDESERRIQRRIMNPRRNPHSLEELEAFTHQPRKVAQDDRLPRRLLDNRYSIGPAQRPAWEQAKTRGFMVAPFGKPGATLRNAWHQWCVLQSLPHLEVVYHGRSRATVELNLETTEGLFDHRRRYVPAHVDDSLAAPPDHFSLTDDDLDWIGQAFHRHGTRHPESEASYSCGHVLVWRIPPDNAVNFAQELHDHVFPRAQLWLKQRMEFEQTWDKS